MKIGIRGSSVHWLAATIVGITVLPIAGGSDMANGDTQPSITWNAAIGRAVLTNGRLELVVETRSGINARSLCDAGSGQTYADRDYAWICGGKPGFPKMDAAPTIADCKDGGRSITFKGRLGEIAVEQLFTLPKNEPGVILEQITISNPTDKPLDTSSFHCGFAKEIRRGRNLVARRREDSLLSGPVPAGDERADAGVPFAGGRSARNGLHRLDGAGRAHAHLGRRGLGVVLSLPSPLGRGDKRFSHRQVQPAGHGMVADGAGQTRHGDRRAFRRGRPVEARSSRGSDAAGARQVVPISAKRGCRRSPAIGSRRTTLIAATSKRRAAAETEGLQSAGALERTVRQRVFRQSLRLV